MDADFEIANHFDFYAFFAQQGEGLSGLGATRVVIEAHENSTQHHVIKPWVCLAH